MSVPWIHALEVPGVPELPEERGEVPNLPVGGVGIYPVSLGYQQRVGVAIHDQAGDGLVIFAYSH